MSLSELKYFKVTNSTTIFSSKPWKQISCIPVGHKLSTSKSSLCHHVDLYFSLVTEKCLTGTSWHDPESCKSTPGRPQLGKFHTGSAQQAAHLATKGFPPREPSLSSAPHQAMRSMALPAEAEVWQNETATDVGKGYGSRAQVLLLALPGSRDNHLPTRKAWRAESPSTPSQIWPQLCRPPP